MPHLSLISLFERLASAPSGRCVVVTPTRRLARALARQFDAWQVARGRTVWESASILPYPAFVAQLYDEAQHDPALTGIRAPISAGQEIALWEQVIESSGVPLASTTGAAQLAAEAWLLAHQWQLAGRLRAYAFTEDTRVFAAWRTRYLQRVEDIGAIDQARLPDEVHLLLQEDRLRPMADVVLVGFDETTPQQKALFAALAARGAGCEILHFENPIGHCTRMPASDARDELARMSDWVVARLAANPAARIGIVVPDLAARRRALTRALDAALEPDALLAAGDRMRPYTVSLGGPLAEAPLVAAALRLLRVLAGEIELEEASALVRSRYLTFGLAADVERFDLDWRERSARLTSLDRMFAATVRDQKHVHPGPRAVFQPLLAWRNKHRRGTRRLSEWAALLTDALRAAGFPGGATLDSNEYQALARWRDLMTEFAALERVETPLSLAAAVSRLARLAGSTVFQPEGGVPPVQVLGLLEARGLEFDHLWIAGLTSDAWPPPARPHPLLPLELQRAEGMPGANPAHDLARARAALERLTRSAPEVVASHAMREGDREVAASSMITTWPAWTPAPSVARAVDAIVPASLETLVDADAPVIDAGAGAVAGGTGVLTDQAACPFRAFGNHRLKANEPAVPHEGLDAAERGQLVHAVLASFWSGLPERTRAFVVAMSDRERRDALGHAADQAIAAMQEQRLGALGPAIVALEKRRLVGLADDWLRYELDHRSDFEVIAFEEWRVLAVGPLSLKGRIDRVDRLAGGRTVVIDYKTGGGAGVRSWLGPRPAEPQLPLYLVATQPDACAVAFARVRAGEQRFIALADDETVLPGAKTDWKDHHADWAALVASWNAELTQLAQDFASGRAVVDPVRLAQTCRYCSLGAVCRLNERLGEAQLEAEESDER